MRLIVALMRLMTPVGRNNYGRELQYLRSRINEAVLRGSMAVNEHSSPKELELAKEEVKKHSKDKYIKDWPSPKVWKLSPLEVYDRLGLVSAEMMGRKVFLQRYHLTSLQTDTSSGVRFSIIAGWKLSSPSNECSFV